jgi:hypothetical protein
MLHDCGTHDGEARRHARARGEPKCDSAGASGVIVGAVTAGTDAARSVADISVAASRSSTAWGADLWVGVELIDTRIQRAAGRLVADDYLQIMAFLSSPSGKDLYKLNAFETEVIMKATRAVSVPMPMVYVAEAQAADGRFHRFSASAAVLESGHILIDFETLTFWYRVRWVNPFWSLAELNASDRVVEVQQFVAKVLTVRVTAAQPASLPPPTAITAPVGPPVIGCRSAIARWFRFGRTIWRHTIAIVPALP